MVNKYIDMVNRLCNEIS